MEATISSTQPIKEQDISKLSYLGQIIEETYQLSNEGNKDSIKGNGEELRKKTNLMWMMLCLLTMWSGRKKGKSLAYRFISNENATFKHIQTL